MELPSLYQLRKMEQLALQIMQFVVSGLLKSQHIEEVVYRLQSDAEAHGFSM